MTWFNGEIPIRRYEGIPSESGVENRQDTGLSMAILLTHQETRDLIEYAQTHKKTNTLPHSEGRLQIM